MKKPEQDFEKYIDDYGTLEIPELSDPSEVDDLIQFISDKKITSLKCYNIPPESTVAFTKLINKCEQLHALMVCFTERSAAQQFNSAIEKHPDHVIQKTLNPYPTYRIKTNGALHADTVKNLIKRMNDTNTLRFEWLNIHNNNVDDLTMLIRECEQL